MKPSEKRTGYSLLVLSALVILVLTLFVLIRTDEPSSDIEQIPETTALSEPPPAPGDEPAEADQPPADAPDKETPPHFLEGMVIDMLTNRSVPEYRIQILHRKTGFQSAPWEPAGPSISVSDIAGAFSVGCIPESDCEYILRVKAEGYHEGSSKVLSRLSGSVTRGIEIRLKPRPCITGTVVAGDRRIGVRGAVVFSYTETGLLPEDRPPPDHVKTDISGRFRLYVKKKGEHTLVIRHPDYRENVTAAVEVGGKETEFRLRQGYSISGKAIAPDGKPIGEARLKITGERAAGLPDWERSITTRTNGTFFMPSCLPPGLCRAELVRITERPTPSCFYGAEPVLIQAWPVDGVHVGQRADRSSVLGTLISDKQPIEGAKVHVKNVTRRDLESLDPGYLHRFEQVAITNERGEFDLYGLWGGEYEIRFTLPGRSIHALSTFRVTCEPGSPWKEVFEVSSGSARGAILNRVTGKKVRKAAAVCLLYRLIDETMEYLLKGSPDREGDLLIPWLARGDYALVVLARGYGVETATFSSRGVGTERFEVRLDPSREFPILVKEEPLGRDDPFISIQLRKRWFNLPAGAVPRDHRGRYVLGLPVRHSLTVRCTRNGQTLDLAAPIQGDGGKDMEFRFDPPSTVRGFVATRRGRYPVEHCRVCLVISDGKRKKTRTYPPLFTSAAVMRNTLTDARGFYEIPLPGEGAYDIVLYGDHGFRLPFIGKRDYLLIRSRSMERHDIQVGDYTFAGQVTPVPRAEVHLSPIRGAQVMTLPDEHGMFMFRNLPEKQYYLQFKAPGYPFEGFPEVKLSRDWQRGFKVYQLGSRGVVLELTLDGPFDREKLGPENVTLELRKGRFRMIEDLPLTRLLRHGKEWTFTAYGLPPGEFTLHVKGGEYSGKTEIDAGKKEPVKATVVLK